MPYAKVAGLAAFAVEDDSGAKPTYLLPYDKNCVAMAFSKCLGVGVYPTINFFKRKNWITKGTDLENDRVIEVITKGLGLDAKYTHEPWSKVKLGMKAQIDGRYFCVNRESRGKDGNGHAFAIIKNGGIGIAGNNAEETDKSYNSKIKDTHNITVYGPISH